MNSTIGINDKTLTFHLKNHSREHPLIEITVLLKHVFLGHHFCTTLSRYDSYKACNWAALSVAKLNPFIAIVLVFNGKKWSFLKGASTVLHPDTIWRNLRQSVAISAQSVFEFAQNCLIITG